MLLVLECFAIAQHLRCRYAHLKLVLQKSVCFVCGKRSYICCPTFRLLKLYVLLQDTIILGQGLALIKADLFADVVKIGYASIP